MRMHIFQNVFFVYQPLNCNIIHIIIQHIYYTVYLSHIVGSPNKKRPQQLSGPKIRKKLSKLVLFNHSMKNMKTFTILKFPVFRTKFSLNLYIYIYIYIYIYSL